MKSDKNSMGFLIGFKKIFEVITCGTGKVELKGSHMVSGRILSRFFSFLFFLFFSFLFFSFLFFHFISFHFSIPIGGRKRSPIEGSMRILQSTKGKKYIERVAW